MVSGRSGKEGKELEALSNIPPFPPIAIRLLKSLSDENVRIQQLVELTRADPKLSLEILRRANSPLYGFISRVDSLKVSRPNRNVPLGSPVEMSPWFCCL